MDLDAEIEASAGRSIPAIFADSGEDAFRAIESHALTRVLAASPHAVVAAGGGVIVRAENRRHLRRQADVVWLDAANEVLARRLEGDSGRPLLQGGSPIARLDALRRDRTAHYTTCADSIVVATAGHDEASTVAQVISAVDALPGRPALRTEPVRIEGGRHYDVLIGSDARDHLAELVPSRAKRVAVVTQAEIGVEVDPGVEHRVFTVPDGEAAKQLDVVGDLCSQFARWGMTRADAVVSVGGGVVSDLAGFVAASYHRGIPVVHVSTSLLGQIDAAIGGKCGVNIPEGKNLVGAFKQPAGVICDIAALDTLPIGEFRAGMGELAKYHFLGGGDLDRLPLTDRVAACVRIKADVVADDETEAGRRAILNYGHTLAHALEAASGYRIRHGEAVAIGLIYAAEVAHRLGRIDADAVAEHRRVVAAYGLDTQAAATYDPDELVESFGRDKKAIDGITFVLDGPRGIEPVRVDDRDLLRDALEPVLGS